MDHPFDDLAVKAAERAIEQTVGMDWPSKDCAQAALTAACKSMKERGKAIDVQYQDDAHPFRPQSNSPVTIFRHGE